MARCTISVCILVSPWVYRYIDMVKARAQRIQQPPLMDIVERVCMRGIRPVVG